jgi:phosphatidylglycerophosphate synthase
LIRPARAGLVAAVCLLAADAVWLVLSRPPYRPVLAAWFLAAAAVGAFVPGWANQVSMVRAHLAAPGLVYASSPGSFGLLAVTVALAGFTDVLDGMVARRFEGTSTLGGALDPLLDGLFFGAVAVGLAAGGAYPAWLAAVVVLRYVIPAAAGGVLLLTGRRPRLRHTPAGQVSTTLIAVLLGGVGLLRALGLDSGFLVLLAEVIIPLAALTTFGNLFWANRGAITGSRVAPGG